MKALTFQHDTLFTIATDEHGHTYRVLLTTGQPLAYRLEPWNYGKRTEYRGAMIREGHALYPSIEAAEAERRAARDAKPIDPKQYERFMSDTI